MASIYKIALRIAKPYTLSRNFYCSTVGSDVSKLGVMQPSSPVIIRTNSEHLRVTTELPREAWIEGLSTIKEEKVGLTKLHPDIFAVTPRMDLIYDNIDWQRKYKKVNFNHAKRPVEMRGPGKGYGRKPWPQKGTGRARQGSRRAPQWVKGGTVHGPRMFTTNFFMLPFNKRVLGLISTLSAKFVQDDLKIVLSLEIPSDESSFLQELIDERCWGNSVLFVDVDDQMPRNIIMSTDETPHLNLLPVFSLNVHSMLKHDTLVLTVAALAKIQERLLFHLGSPDFQRKSFEKYIHY